MWKKLTPVYIVDRIEPCIDFWVGRFGFTKTMDVPEDDHIGFAILAKDNVEIMYQSRTSLRGDIPGLVEHLLTDSSIAYIEVERLEEIESKLDEIEIVFPRRKTFYGSSEIGIRGPGGRIVVFSSHE